MKIRQEKGKRFIFGYFSEVKRKTSGQTRPGEVLQSGDDSTAEGQGVLKVRNFYSPKRFFPNGLVHKFIFVSVFNTLQPVCQLFK